MRLFAIVICWGMVSSALATEVYRWQDAQGTWHFGDQATAQMSSTKTEQVDVKLHNAVKTRVVKLTPLKETFLSRRSGRTTMTIGQREQKLKQHCEQWSERMRFKAFNQQERQQYDQECVAAIKW